MRCYYVLVHGKLTWSVASPSDLDSQRPSGFYCHRYVLASDEDHAARRAFKLVHHNFDRQTEWLSSGEATLTLTADEIVVSPVQKLLTSVNLGHAFYQEE